MLLDEPFAGIDPLAINDIRELITFLKDRGLGILITDHNVRETLQIVDRASIMFDGEVLFEGTPNEGALGSDRARKVSRQRFQLDGGPPMAMTPRLEMRQGQALVMTPQLQQAIKLLQLSNVELQEFVEGELERNPLLEREEGSAEAKKSEDGGDAQALEFDSGMAPSEAALDVSVADIAPDLSANELAEAGAAPMQVQVEVVCHGRAEKRLLLVHLPGIEETLANDKTLAEHLDAQLTEAGLSPVERMIGGVLIDAVDDWGYMRADVLEIAHRIGASDADVLRVLQVMQGFEPTGVMARDIPECPTLQLKERGRFDPAMEALVTNLGSARKGPLRALDGRLCGVDREDLRHDRRKSALTPKPSRLWRRHGAIGRAGRLREADARRHVVELNTDTMPRVLMNQRYYATVSKTAKREEDKQFLTEYAANASLAGEEPRSAPRPSSKSRAKSCANRTASSPTASRTCDR
ncbi:MAG: hypothetical protein R3C30_01540 [Hyphomonadaceae bacterium]